jgi:hypothetical protein
MLCIVVAYFTWNVTGLWEASSFIPNFITTVWLNSPSILSNSWFVQYIMLALFSIPCFFVNQISAYHWVAWAGFMATIIALVCRMVYAFRWQFEGLHFNAEYEIPIVTWDFALDYGVFDSCDVAFFAHPMVSAIAKGMVRPTRNRILASTWAANILVGICVFFDSSLWFFDT